MKLKTKSFIFALTLIFLNMCFFSALMPKNNVSAASPQTTVSDKVSPAPKKESTKKIVLKNAGKTIGWLVATGVGCIAGAYILSGCVAGIFCLCGKGSAESYGPAVQGTMFASLILGAGLGAAPGTVQVYRCIQKIMGEIKSQKS